MIYIATGAAGICMATLLYRSRLIPRWLAILGLVTYPTLLAGSSLDMFNVVDVTQGIGLVAWSRAPCSSSFSRSGSSSRDSTSPTTTDHTSSCRGSADVPRVPAHQRSTIMEHIHEPMAGRTVLVTGATSGIGRATALGLATMGATSPLPAGTAGALKTRPARSAQREV